MTTLGGWTHRARASARVCLALSLMFGSASLAGGTTYYVRVSGDDTRDGLSPDTAFASIRPTGRLLRNPGDRAIVGPGIYREGNIQPLGSGTPDAPIVFLADPTGALTHDPPGPVIILPPNAKDSTTGFIVYGRHDIHIEGFEIDGAKDAGIQVRPRPRTGADSGGITVVNNRANAGHIGIQITAVDDVSVVGNRLSGNKGSGLTLLSGASGALHPMVAGNIFDQNGNGIWASGTSGGAISQNELRSDERDLRIHKTRGLTISGNQFRGGYAGEISGADLAITDNVFEGGATIGATTGTLMFMKNAIGGGGFAVSIRASQAYASVLENRLARLYVGGGAELDLERNDAETLNAEGVETITATDNRFTGSVRILSGISLEAKRNKATDFAARAAVVVVEDNTFNGGANIAADTATVVGNRAKTLSVVRAPRGEAVHESGPFVVAGNVTDGLLKVQQVGTQAAVVEDNASGGLLRTTARHELLVRHNTARGISCLLLAPDSSLVLAENNSHDGAGAGLTVIGAGSAVVENNSSSNSADSGLAARRVKNLLIAGNDFLANPAGGVSVQIPIAGDCNDDLHVTIDEIVTAVNIALGQRPLHDCDAADVDGNGVVTVAELVLSIDDALDPPDIAGSSVEIRANRVERNGRFGIDVFAVGPVSATDNRVVQNGGIPIAVYGRGLPNHTEVIGNVLGVGGAQGLLLEDVAQASVRNNVIFSNREAGILLRDAPGASVVNNLVYANRNDGIAVGLGGTLPTANAVLMNNTLYANAGWGIAIGGLLAPSMGTVILDNILQHNARGGIAAGIGSLLGLTIGFNLNDDGYGDGLLPDATDFTADPQFVAPAGADGVLGGEGFADDDFHLRPTSPAIDAGSGPAAALGITGSAVAGLASDEGIVDLGYHYGADPQ